MIVAINRIRMPTHWDGLIVSLKKSIDKTRGTRTPTIRKISISIYALFLTEMSHETTKIAVDMPDNAVISSKFTLGVIKYMLPSNRMTAKPIAVQSSVRITFANTDKRKLLVCWLVFFPQYPFVTPANSAITKKIYPICIRLPAPRWRVCSVATRYTTISHRNNIAAVPK